MLFTFDIYILLVLVCLYASLYKFCVSFSEAFYSFGSLESSLNPKSPIFAFLKVFQMSHKILFLILFSCLCMFKKLSSSLVILYLICPAIDAFCCVFNFIRHIFQLKNLILKNFFHLLSFSVRA